MKASSIYLERLHMAAFGRFFDASVGPFGPGLNVVYGENETGKTTLNAFICGVLFGWEDARGQKNVYKSEIARRSGTLFFAGDDGKTTYEVSRTRNVDGASFEPAEVCALTESIDKDTFSTMFALTSDELRGLEGATDMTSKLLTAGSGTNISPAQALAEIDRRIAAYTSRAASASDSFVHLRAEEDECKRKLACARERSDALKAEYREYTALAADRQRRADEVASLNALVEKAAACRLEAVRLDREAKQERLRIQECDERLALLGKDEEKPVFADAAAEAEALAVIERLHDETARLAHRLDAARDAFAAARAQLDEEAPRKGAQASAFRGVTAAFALIALVAAVGAGLFLWRFDATAAIASGAVCAIAAACSAWTAYVGRGQRQAQAAGKSASRQALDRARSVLEACEEEDLALSLRVRETLDSLGLQAACGSLSQAKALVEASRERRMRSESRLRAVDDLSARRRRSQESLREALSGKEGLFAQCGIDPGQGISAFGQQEDELRARRDEAVEDMRRADARQGELKQLLREGALSNELDVLKTRQEQINTRKEDSAAGLAELLFARRIMERALDAWKSESVPAVYRRASELFSLMTNGAWREIRMQPDGTLVAIDAVRKRLEPRFLSMGTCQQLYLALRIALLECASDVGAGLPVLADDILVNFDDERRIAAVKALVELSSSRQVILFTCHKEILETVRHHAADCTVVAL